MTFRPPGATPISIVDPGSERPAEEETQKQKQKQKSLPAPVAKKPGASKVALIVAGFVALAALGVAVGWFLTN